MCSIIGYLGKEFTAESIRPYFDRTVSRGPDQTRMLPLPGGFLGFHRLSIMGLTEAGMQPFLRGDGAVVCNGEIYGFRAIRERLQKQGYIFHSDSDCEILLPLYQEKGVEMFQDLDAEFALVLYDGQQLIAARDPIGIRPLYYGYDRDGAPIFASEPKNLVGLCDRILPFPPGHYYKDGKFVCYRDVATPKTHCTDGLETACKKIHDKLVAGIEKRLDADAPVGFLLSGGLDSTLALLVTVEAMRQLGRPASEVYGVTMPCYGTSDRTYRNSLELMEKLGVSCKEVNIRQAVDIHFRDIGHDKSLLNGTYENAQARERTQILMDYASVVGGIVIGTGDLSELALGWCTYNGDHMSMYGVNASIPKTLIRWMIAAIADSEAFAPAKAVLEDILDTPISPELLPPDESGKISQYTEDLVGPYALHDFFLYYMLRFGFAPRKIFTLACRAFEGDFDGETVKKWLKAFYRRFFTQQFKRSCLPDGVKVGSVCLSPRGDWRMPSDAVGRIWLQEVEQL